MQEGPLQPPPQTRGAGGERQPRDKSGEMGIGKESKRLSHNRMGEAPATSPGLQPLLIYTVTPQPRGSSAGDGTADLILVFHGSKPNTHDSTFNPLKA